MTSPRPDAPDKVLADYREKAAQPGLRPVLDAGDDGDVKNAYLDYVHRRTLRKWLPRMGSRVVDLGCGIGRLTELLEASIAIGVDASPDLLALARTRLGPGALLARGDLGALPLQSGALTGAMMCFVSLHLDDETLERAFGDVARVLQPGGVFLLFEHVSPTDEPRLYHGVVDRPVAALVATLEAAGFDVIARRAAKKTPSRAVHWVRTGRLPRVFWRVGAWFDKMTARFSLEHADYVEALFVARKRGGLEAADLPTARDMAISMFVPPIWMRRRPGGTRAGE